MHGIAGDQQITNGQSAFRRGDNALNTIGYNQTVVALTPVPVVAGTLQEISFCSSLTRMLLRAELSMPLN